MTADSSGPFDDAISTEEAFEAALEDLLTEAHENDIDPAGSWVYRNDPYIPDWEVQVTELVKQR